MREHLGEIPRCLLGNPPERDGQYGIAVKERIRRAGLRIITREDVETDTRRQAFRRSLQLAKIQRVVDHRLYPLARLRQGWRQLGRGKRVLLKADIGRDPNRQLSYARGYHGLLDLP